MLLTERLSDEFIDKFISFAHFVLSRQRHLVAIGIFLVDDYRKVIKGYVPSRIRIIPDQ